MCRIVQTPAAAEEEAFHREGEQFPESAVEEAATLAAGVEFPAEEGARNHPAVEAAEANPLVAARTRPVAVAAIRLAEEAEVEFHPTAEAANRPTAVVEAGAVCLRQAVEAADFLRPEAGAEVAAAEAGLRLLRLEPARPNRQQIPTRPHSRQRRRDQTSLMPQRRSRLIQCSTQRCRRRFRMSSPS